MRTLSAITAALALGSAAAFMPNMPTPAEVVKGAQRFVAPAVAILGVNAAPMVVPPAHADGAVSAATVTRAGALYGPRVIALKSAADKGDFAAFQAEDGACRLFNSGAFAMNRPQQKKVVSAYADVQKAVAAKDAAALKSAYANYYKTAGLDKQNPFGKKDRGQAYSSDFMFTINNKNFDTRVE